MFNKKRFLAIRNRNAKSFSLVFVMGLGLITTLAALAITETLFPVSRYSASQISMQEANSLAENSMQYAIAMLNNAAKSGSLSSFNSPITIPTSIRNSSNASVTMVAISQPNLQSCPIYQTQTATPTGGPLQQDYRELTAQATVGLFTRTIKVVVGPNQLSPRGATPFFSQALVTNSNLNISGVSVLNDPSFPNPNLTQAIISSNQQLAITGPATIGGTLNAYNAGGTNSLSLPALPTNGSAPSVIINGNVTYSAPQGASGSASGLLTDSAGTATPGANVFGDGVNGGTTAGSINATAATNVITAPSPVLAPAQAAEFNVSGTNNSVVQQPATSSVVTDLGAINLTSGQKQSLTISPGTYVASSLDLGANATMTLNQASAANPVQIYLQGNTGQSPLTINGSIAGNTTPSGLQIFYNGQQSIQITMGAKSNPNFYGLIYAPNATVSIDTMGGNFYGSVVANNLSIKNSTSGTNSSIFYNPSIASTSGANAGPGYTAATTVQGFNILSWQEINGATTAP